MLFEAKSFQVILKGQVVLKPVDFKIHTPFFLIVAGLNGAGKSSMLRAMTGEIPFSGTLRFNGKEFPPKSIGERSGTCAYLPQHNKIGFDIPVIELVVMGRARFRGMFEPFNEDDYALAKAALEQVGAAHLENRDFLELSGGEQQLVWISQLLVQDSEISLFDEPTQHLDLGNKRRVVEILSGMVASGKSVVLVSHDLFQLREVKGSLINLSADNPQLLEMDRDVLMSQIDQLEKSIVGLSGKS